MSLRRTAGRAVITLALATAAPLWAQEAPSLPAEQCASPVSVVAQFLQLSPPQAEAFQQLLVQREQSLAPILQQIALREQQIQQLIASGGDPAQIGQLMIEVHQLRQAAHAVE